MFGLLSTNLAKRSIKNAEAWLCSIIIWSLHTYALHVCMGRHFKTVSSLYTQYYRTLWYMYMYNMYMYVYNFYGDNHYINAFICYFVAIATSPGEYKSTCGRCSHGNDGGWSQTKIW